MLTDTRLYREDSRELLLKHPQWYGLILVPAGLAFVLLGLNPEVSAIHTARAYVGAAACLVGGLLYLSFRDRWVLDLERRTYYRHGGFFLAPQASHGSFDEIERVVMVRRTRAVQWWWDSPETWWIQMVFRARGERVSLESLHDESTAYYRLEHFARLLGAPAFEFRDGAERRVQKEGQTAGAPPAAPGEPASTQVPERAAAATSEVPARGAIDAEEHGPSVSSADGRMPLVAPPADSGIELRGAPGRETILLPPVLPWQALVFAAVGVVVALAVGMTYLRSAIESTLERLGSVPLGTTLLGLLWLALACGVGWAGLRLTWRRFQIERRGNFLRFSSTPGLWRQSQMLHRKEIQEIDLRQPIPGR
ncbi:MAG: hypothetical protein AAF657_29885, partial [Acidobacteriota bacterium]